MDGWKYWTGKTQILVSCVMILFVKIIFKSCVVLDVRIYNHKKFLKF